MFRNQSLSLVSIMVQKKSRRKSTYSSFPDKPARRRKKTEGRAKETTRDFSCSFCRVTILPLVTFTRCLCVKRKVRSPSAPGRLRFPVTVNSPFRNYKMLAKWIGLILNRVITYTKRQSEIVLVDSSRSSNRRNSLKLYNVSTSNGITKREESILTLNQSPVVGQVYLQS
jgi:hypothetical protein